MSRFLLSTHYLIIVPILVLALAASLFFLLGGIGLVRLLIEVLSNAVGLTDTGVETGHSMFFF